MNGVHKQSRLEGTCSSKLGPEGARQGGSERWSETGIKTPTPSIRLPSLAFHKQVSHVIASGEGFLESSADWV